MPIIVLFKIGNNTYKNNEHIIYVNDKIFSTKVTGYQNRAPDDYTTYRPGWKKTWNWSA